MPKQWSWKQKWTICKGANADDSMQIAKVSRDAKFMKYGTLHIQLANDDQSAYTLQASGGWTCTRDVDLLFHGQVIGHAKLTKTASAIFLNKMCYEVTINPGYDHAFLLCIIVIMNAYYHQYVTAAVIA